jgi:AcrR family transcriptional regulator
VTEGTSVRLTRDERRDALVEAAAALVASDVTSVSMEAVAEAAGVSRPLVYKHFANRAELLVAVYRRETATLHEELAEAVRTARGLEAKFRALVRGALRGEAERGAALSALRAAGARNHELREEQRRRDQGTVAYFARHAARELGTDPKPTRDTVSILLRSIEAVLADWRLRPTPSHAERLEETYATICMGALERLARAQALQDGVTAGG